MIRLCSPCTGQVFALFQKLLLYSKHVHRCVAKIASFQKCSHCAGSIQITSQLPFQISVVHSCVYNSPFTNEMLRCNFCSDKNVQTGSGPFQKPIRYRTFHFLQRSKGVLFRSKNCSRTSASSVNRGSVRYTFCNAPFTIWYSVNDTPVLGVFLCDVFFENPKNIDIQFSTKKSFSKEKASLTS